MAKNLIYPLIHPGLIVQDELNEIDMVRKTLAHMLCVEHKEINDLCTGKLRINPKWACKLSKALGASPEFWLNLQHNYDIQELNHLIS